MASFNCGGTIHQLTQQQLSRSGYLSALVNQDKLTVKRDDEGNIIIEDNPVLFSYVVYLLRTGELHKSIIDEYKDELKFYCISADDEYPPEFEEIRKEEQYVRANHKVAKVPLIKLTDEILNTQKPFNVEGRDLILHTPNKAFHANCSKRLNTVPVFPEHLIDADFDYSNICIAGGAVINFLLGLFINDIDIFLIIPDESIEVRKEKAMNKIRDIIRYIHDKRKLYIIESDWYDGGGVDKKLMFVERGKYVITIYGAVMRRPVQIILRIYNSINEVLAGFDVDSCCFAYDGKNFLTTKRGLYALQHRVNCVDFTRLSPTYERRLVKYAERGFSIYVPYFKRDLINIEEFARLTKSYKQYLLKKEHRKRGYLTNGLKYLLCAEYKRSMIEFNDCKDGISENFKSDYEHGTIEYMPERLLLNEALNIAVGKSDPLREKQTKNLYAYRTSRDYYVNGESTTHIHEYIKRFVMSEKAQREAREDGTGKFKRLNSIVFLYELHSKFDYRLHSILGPITKIPLEIEFITENPGQQLTTSFNAIVLDDNNKWYGNMLRPSYDMIMRTL
jgi:hypothetical protein